MVKRKGKVVLRNGVLYDIGPGGDAAISVAVPADQQTRTGSTEVDNGNVATDTRTGPADQQTRTGSTEVDNGNVATDTRTGPGSSTDQQQQQQIPLSLDTHSTDRPMDVDGDASDSCTSDDEDEELVGWKLFYTTLMCSTITNRSCLTVYYPRSLW